MATDGPTPAPCNPDIFKNGQCVCVVDGPSRAVEDWVQKVAKTADAQVDWHYSGGRAVVLHLGDGESRQRVLEAINNLEYELDGTILSVNSPEDVYSGPTAVVRKIDGQLVLDDPLAVSVIRAVDKLKCRNTFKMNADRITHFKQRLSELGMTADQAVIVLLNVNDVHGGPLADALMPGQNWQKIRDLGQVPFARGLAMRAGIVDAISLFDEEAANKLKGMAEVAVVVVDRGVAEVFAA